MHRHQILILGQLVIFVILAFLEFLIAFLQGCLIGAVNLVKLVNPYLIWCHLHGPYFITVSIFDDIRPLIANLVGRFVLLNA